MTKFTKVDKDITEYKPKMKPVYVTKTSDLRVIPVAFGEKTTAQVKADGEFNYIYIDRKSIYALNRFGRKTEDLPALNELHETFLAYKPFGCNPLHKAELLAEMYAVDLNGKPLPLPKFIHYLKGSDGYSVIRHNSIHLGLFGLLNVDGVKGSNFNSEERFNMLSKFNGNLCHVLDYIVPENWEDVEKYYTQKVQNEGWEGLVIRVNGDTYKAKPNRDIDAVIIGINKNTKGFEKGLAKSIRVALLNENGNFVELGDATVASDDEARELFALTRVKVYEDTATVFVRPLVIVQIAYISLFPDTINSVRDTTTLKELNTTHFVRMKSPRIMGYRRDKKVCAQDIGVNQIEVE